MSMDSDVIFKLSYKEIIIFYIEPHKNQPKGSTLEYFKYRIPSSMFLLSWYSWFIRISE